MDGCVSVMPAALSNRASALGPPTSASRVVAASLSLASIIGPISAACDGGSGWPLACAWFSAAPMICTLTMLAVYSCSPGCSTQVRRARASYTAAVIWPFRPAR